MSNVLDQHRQQQIVALGRLGWSLRRIEETTGVRRETVSDYLKSGRRAGARPGRPPAGLAAKTGHHSGGIHRLRRVETGNFRRGVHRLESAQTGHPGGGVRRPRTGPTAGRAPSASACEPYRELIERALERGRNAMAIWQDLVDAHGFSTYSNVDRAAGARNSRPTCVGKRARSRTHQSRSLARGGRFCPVDQWPVFSCPPRHEKDVPGKVVAQLMGHVNVDTTLNVYTQVLDGAVRAAVENVGGELFTIVH
jgi:hypothetical protein